MYGCGVAVERTTGQQALRRATDADKIEAKGQQWQPNQALGHPLLLLRLLLLLMLMLLHLIKFHTDRGVQSHFTLALLLHFTLPIAAQLANNAATCGVVRGGWW